MAALDDLAEIITAGTPITVRVGVVTSASDPAHPTVSLGEREVSAAWPSSAGHPVVGTVCTLLVGDGVARVITSAQSDPPGTMSAYAGAAAPAGWLLCEGQTVGRDDYPGLFAAIGTAYGAGDGSTTFRLPDARGRVLVGRAATQSEFASLGQSGGAKTHTLSTAEMPSHTHSSGEGSDGFAAHRSSTGAYSAVLPTGPSGEVMVYRQPASTGGDGSHNNLQPYLVINHIIKT